MFRGEKKALKTAVAVVMSLICLGVPALMAQQNWDDHDRSDRYSCRDFGANYLRSCEDQAIVFSNGDNDTFPLWYNQEVEGEGTNLRVCNLSYLQTDWYISQMKRPYYTSAALPISWQPEDYMPGKNEVVWVDNKLGTPLSVKEAFNFVRSTDKRTKRDGESYIPTDKLYIPIDSVDLINTEWAEADVASQLDIKVGRRLTRSEMMVLEMLSTNHWKRPIHFAVTVGNDYYQGLERYFELTGMTYQVTPVASTDGHPRVNTEKMYENMMHRFRYGNMNKPGIYIDENLMRMCRTHRMRFAQLADALIDEGDTLRAVEVLDYAEKMLPGYNIPYDYTSATMALNYYKCGQPEKADAILDQVANTDMEYLKWGSTLDKQGQKAMMPTLSHHASVLFFVLQNFERNQRTEMFNKWYALYEQYAGVIR